jgi:hypothetical protein
MITNCLDTTQNTWDNDFTGDGNWSKNNYATQTYNNNELAKASTAIMLLDRKHPAGTR